MSCIFARRAALGAITALAACLPLAVLPSTALAFGTIQGKLGQSSEHEKITRLALKDAAFGPNTLDQLAGKTHAFGAVGVSDIPGGGLFSESKAHCDNGDFLDVPGYPQSRADAAKALKVCRDWIMLNLNKAVTDAGELVALDLSINAPTVPLLTSDCVFSGDRGRAKCNVLGDIGLAYHTSQDFYSHSNWTDSAADGAIDETNPPGLGNVGRAPWLDPRKSDADIVDDKYPAGLITGCFQGPLEQAKIYCRYHTSGVSFATRVKHMVLNKDEGPLDAATGAMGTGVTIRGKVGTNFANAVAAAIEDSTDKWAFITERIKAAYPGARGDKIICVIKSDDPASCN